MNILPFVTIFLVLLAMLSHFFFDQSKTLLQEKKMLSGYQNTQRLLMNELQKKAYLKAPSTQPRKKPSSPKINLQTRDSKKLPKMHLYPLFSKTPHPLAKQTFYKLLDHLYFKNQNFAELAEGLSAQSFGEHFLKKASEVFAHYQKENLPLALLSFTNLYPDSIKEQKLYYKMLKGTHVFTPQEGYPPISSLFSLHASTEEKIFSFSSLTPQLLSVIFGEEIAKNILQQELLLLTENTERTRKTLSKEELLSFVHEKFPTASHLDNLIELLDFSESSPKETSFHVMDPSTLIIFEKNTRI